MVGVTGNEQERIRRYIETHPDAIAAEVRGQLAKVGVPPDEHEDVIERLLNGEQVDPTSDVSGDTIPDEPDDTPPSPADCREVFAERLRDANLDTQRFIDVQDGEKGTYDHTQYGPDASALSGNYGVYGGAGAGDNTGWVLVDIDVDDYDGERAPNWIPETLTVASPHTDGQSGGHFYVALPTGTTDSLEEAFGTANPKPSWGEIRVHNQYCVGPGSQLDGCSKEWCDDCADPDGGYYRLKSDAPIAQLEIEEFVAALQEDMPDRGPDDSEQTAMDAFDDFDLEDYDPDVTDADETTDDIRDVFVALERIDAQRVADKTIVHRWNDAAMTSDNYRAFVPTWGKNANGTANIVDDRIWQDTGASGYGGPVVMALIDLGEMRPSTASPQDARGELFWKGVDHLRDLGFSIPELSNPNGPLTAESSNGPGHAIETCTPPVHHPVDLDIDERRKGIDDSYDTFIETDRPVIRADAPGVGKTVTTSRAAARRDRKHAVLFDKHEKAREFQLDDVTPDGYFHLKGGAQKRKDVCMDADHTDEECPEHGHGSNCPHMCSVYDLAKDNSRREQYDVLKEEVGPVRAHQIMDLHGDAKCAWLEQFDGLEHEDRIVGVHQYQVLKTLRDDRDILVDEKTATLETERTLEVDGLTRASNLMGRLADLYVDDEAHNLREFARFTEDVVDVITDPNSPETLEALTPPDIKWQTFIDVKDPISMAGVKKRLYGETLAQAKLEFNESVLANMHPLDGWKGTPLCFDTILLAAREAGLNEEAVRKAVAAPLSLSHCPWCHSQTEHSNGVRTCPECRWHEEHNTILQEDAERARGNAQIVTGVDDNPTALNSRVLPLQSELPSAPLILNATPAPGAVKGLYGAEPLVLGDEPVDATMTVTQVADGQYHHSTVKQSQTAQERIQSTIDTAAQVHDRVLVIGRKDAYSLFDFPENTEWLHYHANRGLNRGECDAVICIGAPHPDIADLERTAELLAMDTDLRVGGDEHSTRRNAPNQPTYRKLLYEDENGDGRAIPTKHYTGLVGELFRADREAELEQSIHRIRPVLADQPKHVYLLTNVPTDIPVDQFVTFEELAGPLRAMLPVPDGAIQLLEHVHEVLDGNAPDGFRAKNLLEETADGVVNNKWGFHRLAILQGMDVSYKTVSDWVNALEDVGVLDAGEYVQREGVRFSVSRTTLNSALQVISGNGGFKVAAKRRLRQKIKESGSLGNWLTWAQEVFDLSGDRCGPLTGTGPPGLPVD